MKPIAQKKLVPDKERIKCGKCEKKTFNMHLVRALNLVEVSCHSCGDICLMIPLPKKKEEKKDGESKITEPVRPKIIC